MRPLALVLSTLLAAAAPAAADVFHLDDGTAVEGVRVGEVDGVLLVFTDRGQRELDAARVARVTSSEVDGTLARRAARARERFLRRRGYEAGELLERHARADEDDERAEVAAELARFPEEALVDPLEEALDAGDAATRAFALGRLAELEDGAGLAPLLRAALTTSHDDVRLPAHEAAVGIDRTRARTIYEAVAASRTTPLRRFKALHLLGRMGEEESVPELITVLERVKQELRTVQARAGDLRRAPVDLGSGSSAGRDVPIELPEMERTEVNATVRAKVLRQLRAKAAETLRQVTGADRGDDPDAWRRWWEERPQQPTPSSR